MNCFNCNRNHNVKYVQNTCCHTCYIRFRRTGSYSKKDCQNCAKALNAKNTTGYCDPCRKKVFAHELYLKRKEQLKDRQDEVKAYQKAYRLAHKEEIKASKKEWYINNLVYASEKAHENYLNNIEKRKNSTKTWNKNNPKKRYVSNKIRQERKKFILDEKLEQEVKNYYLNCPKGMTVDHIIPLNGKDVSGLHVPWNFQYLTPSENFQKSRKFDGTYDNNSWKLQLNIKKI